jgi:Protein of unknown function DUF86
VRDDREASGGRLGRDRQDHVHDDRTRFDTDEVLRPVSDKVRAAHPEVPWRAITDMRNRVSYGYFDIDLDVVWNTVTRDLPKLCPNRGCGGGGIRQAWPRPLNKP